MINYSDENILNEKVKRCLTFDPFRVDADHPYGINTKIDLKQKNHEEIKQMQLNYYQCAMNCFDLYENINIFKYHYELSCLCIKSCFDKLETNFNKE